MAEQNFAKNAQAQMAGNIGQPRPPLKPIAGLATNLAGTRPVVPGQPVAQVQNAPRIQAQPRSQDPAVVPTQPVANVPLQQLPPQIPVEPQLVQPQLTPEQIEALDMLELQQEQILNQAVSAPPQQFASTETPQQQLVKQGRIRGRVDNFLQPKPLENSTLKFLIAAGIASAVIYIVTLVL